MIEKHLKDNRERRNEKIMILGFVIIFLFVGALLGALIAELADSAMLIPSFAGGAIGFAVVIVIIKNKN